MIPDPDDILERAAKAGGKALADAHGWLGDRGAAIAARTVTISARPVIEAPLRAEIARHVEYLRQVRAMLRIECAAYDDNDWPDNLHLVDVVEKHLARSARSAIIDLERERDALLAENKQLRAALEMIADVGPHGSVPLCRHTAAKALAQTKEPS